ncbi:DUF3137 domain-containing protein [Campylobacter concisus]|uniref:DUF3137 domain-containing protein n=1 Tax=Campylobacter concisus TaxID=199 RepID=UPI001CE3BAB8|nr:DUF3137 domain-containing protein [Campylobacter concisus]MCA6130787.1 DUF3137 domain-containing protein [Campylobacter concisus]MCA6132282.1 DUF3137 domain-containing protein [Campylobacter concisus]
MQADELKGIDLSDLDELEKERLAMGQKAFKMIAYGFLGIIVATGFLASLHLGNLFFFLLIGGVFYLGKTINGLKNELVAKFKQKVVGVIVKNYGLNFSANGGLSLNDFLKIYDVYVNRHNAEDMIYGQIDNTQFKLCDFYAAEETRSSKGGTYTTVKFQGILLKAEFKKELNATIYVCDKKRTSDLRSDGEQATMDNPKFNELFKTYTTDQIAARYALTPKLMENLTTLRTKFNAPLSAVFLKNEIYIAIDLRKDSFEPDLKKPINSNESVQNYISSISDFSQIMHDLELNKNIWKS